MLGIFLILLAGGVQFASAIPNPRHVAGSWIRLASMISIGTAMLAAVLAWREHQVSLIYGSLAVAIIAGAAANVLHRVLAPLAFATTIYAVANWIPVETAVSSSILCGLGLMDMLLGHAYLTARDMPISVFGRFNPVLAAAISFRMLTVAAETIRATKSHEQYWQLQGLFIATWFLVGLVVPCILVVMAQACIRRRATQSATGILFVACALIFLGELLAIVLVRSTEAAL